MADHGHNHEHEAAPRGKMDISDHLAMWNSFWEVSKWSVVGLMGLALLLAIFRTHNGYY